MTKDNSYFFCGIGGSGMSSIAQVLLHQGYGVRGSDRSRDRGLNRPLYENLAHQGVVFFPQDGSGVDAGVDTLVVSGAVEPTISDVKAAVEQDIPIQKRAEVLAWLFHRSLGVAVGGTSGKSTVTGMIGHILRATGRDPTVINGGIMRGAVSPPYLGNAVCGRRNLLVIEADESDGTIVLYDPTVAVLTNISLDHKEMDELKRLFGAFCERAQEAVVVNLNCETSAALTKGLSKRVTFGIENQEADVRANQVVALPDGMQFVVNGAGCRLRVPGRHNVANAAAAIAACEVLEVPVAVSAEVLSEFQGIGRRLEVVGQVNGVTVIDDFAHHPTAVSLTLNGLKQAHPERRLVAVFEPASATNARALFEKRYIEAFTLADALVITRVPRPERARNDEPFSPDRLVQQLRHAGKKADYLPDVDSIAAHLVAETSPGDLIVFMSNGDFGGLQEKLLTALQTQCST